MNISFLANIGLQKKAAILILIASILFNFNNYLNAGSANYSQAKAERFRIMFGNNPSTEMTIGFDAQYVGSNPVLFYSTSPINVNNLGNYLSKTPDKVVNYHDMINCFVRLTNLLPGQTYYFLVRDNFGTSEVYNFETIPNTDNTQLSIIAGGDSRSNLVIRSIANRVVSKLNAHALIFDGDFVASGHSATQWQRWLDDWQLTFSSNNRITPIIPARGNHESNNDMLINLFDCPPDIVYSRTLGNNLFQIYTLNTENLINSAGTQTTWLENELSNSNSIWKFAQYHKPIRPHTIGKPEGSRQYAYWANLFYKYGVDAVLEGDVHMVKTTWPLIPCSGGFGCYQGFKRDDNNGTVYLGEGSYAAPLRDANDTKPWTRDSGKFHQFKLLFVNKNKMEIRTVKYDTITNTNAINELSATNRFTVPGNLEIWNPENGDVVTLNKSLNQPTCTLTKPVDNEMLFNLNEITLSADATGTSAIAMVQFYVDGRLVSTDPTMPYQSKWQPPSNGNYIISAIAKDVNGLSSNLDFSVIKVGAKSNIVHTSSIDIGTDECFEHVNKRISSFKSVPGYVAVDEWLIPICKPGISLQGLRFKEINIPPTAIIDSAYFVLNPKNGFDVANATIWGEHSVNSLPFISVPFNLTDRQKTSNSVSWNNITKWDTSARKEDATSPDLKVLIQELVDQPGWTVESPITLLINGTGNRNASSFMANQNSAIAPTLVVHFCVSNDDDILGCTNPKACNFNPEATKDDGSCFLPKKTCTNCSPPAKEDITLYPNGTTVGIAWEAIPGTNYKLLYRASGEADFRTYTTSIPFVILFGLNDCTTYQFAISKICEDGRQSEKSEILSYTTTECGKAGENITIRNQQTITIYPNPATNYLSIELLGNSEVDLINIYDITGKLVIAQNEISYNGAAYRANIKQLSQGVYFVKTVKDNYTTTKKFLVR